MLGFIPSIHDALDCRNKSGNDKDVGCRSPNKKWGTIAKKGAPLFPVFPVVVGLCEGQTRVNRAPERR